MLHLFIWLIVVASSFAATITVRELPPLHETQKIVDRSTARFVIVVAGRRWGKTRFGVRQCVKVALAGGRAWWVAPSYKLSKPGWRVLRKIARQIPGTQILLSERTIIFPGGGEVVVRTGADPDELRGDDLDFCVLDEYAGMHPDVWGEAIRPALIDRRGGALFISTPKGVLNSLFELWEQARDGGDDAEGEARWERFTFTTYDNPLMSHDEIEELRQDMTERAFEQEIMAKFLTEVGAMFRADRFRYFEPKVTSEQDDDGNAINRLYYAIGYGDQKRMIDASGGDIYITCDPATTESRLADFTAFAVWHKIDALHFLLEVVREQIESPDVLERAQQLADKYRRAQWVGFESRGFQKALSQFARKLTTLKIKELHADSDKVTRAWPLADAVKDGEVFFLSEAPWLTALEHELLFFPNGEHDDQVDALAYGVNVKVKRRWGAT